VQEQPLTKKMAPFFSICHIKMARYEVSNRSWTKEQPLDQKQILALGFLWQSKKAIFKLSTCPWTKEQPLA
jgi:hypothetical protein